MQPLGRLMFNRGFETFPKEIGNLDESQEMFFSSILDDEDSLDPSTVQNSINFARSFCELGKTLKQTILNKIFFSSLRFQQFVPQLILFSKYYRTRSWIYNAIFHAMKHHFHLFRDSIINNHPIWSFILEKFEEDFQEKTQMLRTEYSEHPHAFLFECIIFGWEFERTDSIEVEDLVKAIAQFLASIPSSTITDTLLSYMCAVFPEIVISTVPGAADRMSVQCLQQIVALGLHTKYELGTNKALLAMKMIPADGELAKSIIDGCEEQDVAIFNEMLQHFDEGQGRFVPE